MNGPNQAHSASGLLRPARILVLAFAIAVASTSLGFACQGGGGGGGGGSGGGGGGGGGGGAGGGHSAGSTPLGTKLPGFVPAMVRLMLGAGMPFVGVNVAGDFASGNCTGRTGQEVAQIPGGALAGPETQAPMTSEEELANIITWLTESPAGREFVANIKASIPPVSGVGGEAAFRDMFAAAEINRLAQQIKAANDLVKQQRAAMEALRAERARPNSDPNLIFALEFALHGSTAVAATEHTRIGEAFAGARVDAETARRKQKEANIFMGGFAVNVMTNLTSGALGSAVGGAWGVVTDVGVGGLLNYGEAQFYGGASDPLAGNKAVVTNTLSGLMVNLGEEMLGVKFGAVKEGIKVGRGALASAVGQGILDNSVKLEDEHNKKKAEAEKKKVKP